MSDLTPPADDERISRLLDEARVPGPVKAASISLSLTSLLVIVLAVQNVTLIRWAGDYAIAPWALAGLGVLALIVGAKQWRARSWTRGAGLLLALLLAAGTSGFFIVSVTAGLYTLLSVVVAAATVVALVMQVLAIGAFARLAATRRRLREAGYDLDL